MNANNPNERLLRFLQATPEQQAAIDRILNGEAEPVRRVIDNGPLLVGMGKAASILGVSRGTLWRMLKAGRLEKVEVLPGSFRVRRADIEALACGHQAHGHQACGHEVGGDAGGGRGKAEG